MVWTQSLTFYRWHFKMHFLDWKCLHFDKHFTDICFQMSNWQQVTTGSGNSLASKRRTNGSKCIKTHCLKKRLHNSLMLAQGTRPGFKNVSDWLDNRFISQLLQRRSHIIKCTIQNRNVHISFLNGAFVGYEAAALKDLWIWSNITNENTKILTEFPGVK